MAGKSTYYANIILDYMLGSANPATVYVALFTSAPTDAGGGTEAAGGSYARAAVTNNSTNFPNAAAGAKSNAVDIVFADATAAWGTIVAVGIYDALSSGNLLFWTLLVSPIPVPNGARFNFAAAQLEFTED